PDRPLSIVATVAAPVDAGPFDHEEEMYLLWRALGEKKQEKRLLITDRGILDDLAGAVERHRPPVVHFTGHGRPGELLFEDEEALSDPVDVTELIRRFRETGPLPRLIYLSACHGTTAEPAAAESHPGERMVDHAAVDRTAPSTAASLHRAGFPQVVAYFGPVQDRQATRAASAFYAALGRGRTAWEALRQARRISAEPLRDAGRATHVYPLGWAQLALYHRGPDHATTLPPASGGATVDLPQEERKRIFERLDQAGGSQRVEHGIVGVQRLRFGFVGRRRERAEAIRRWKKGQRLLVVQGLGGLGKTTLCAEVAPVLAETLRPGTRVLALDGRYAGTQPDPVAALWQEVQAARSDQGWSQVLAGLQKEGLTAEALARALVTLAQIEEGLLVYLDDAESLQARVGEGEVGRWRDQGFAQFWQYLVEAAEGGEAFGILASSRYQPEGTPSRAVLPLPEMSRYEVVRLLSWMPTLGRMPLADRAWVAEKVEGHPRTVEYLEALARAKEEDIVPPGGQYAGGRWREEILEPILPETEKKVDSDLLLGKLWESLPPAAQEHLGRCSVLTAPVPWQAIQALALESDTDDRLFEAGLLSPFQPPFEKEVWWAPHRLVAEEALSRWSGEPKKAHLLLAEWLEKRFEAESTDYWRTRAVEHFLAAGEADRAWPTARLLILSLRHAGRYQEALGWAERVLAAGPTGGALGKALTFKVQLQISAGLLEPEAEGTLLRALELVAREDKGFVFAQLGALCNQQGKLRMPNT
ncbi:MAG TPA: CHAT domain-containing protein, partial [Thermoanaerobaculia bacterium]|nr:CHAT domain-containing protein [Thermoanaerobaculia bacterium]